MAVISILLPAAFLLIAVLVARREMKIGQSTRDTGDLEPSLATGLLTGRLDQAGYRNGMASLARTDDETNGRLPVCAGMMDEEHLELCARLGIAMPELPPSAVCASVALARTGAGVEELARLMHLTVPQALRIVVRTRVEDSRR